MMAKISVVMPIYNASKYLKEAIRSVQSQTFSDWELLCIDDGSTDNSREIVYELSASEPRIKLHCCDHRGIVRTLNYGVQRCSSDFIARMDSDDIANPQRFEMQLQFLVHREDVDFLGTAYQVIDTQGRWIKSVTLPESAKEIGAKLMHSNCMAHPTVMMRTDALRKLKGPYREGFLYAEDYDLWLRAIEQSSFANLPTVLLSYRRDLSRSKCSRLTIQARSTLAAQASYHARLRGDGDPADTWLDSAEVELPLQTHERYMSHFNLQDEAHLQLARRMLLADAREAVKQGHSATSEELRTEAVKLLPTESDFQDKLDLFFRLLKLKLTRRSKMLLSSALDGSRTGAI